MAEPQGDNIFEQFIKALPLFTGYLIAIGLVKEIVFYHYFGIPILEYISVSDGLLFSLDDFMSIIAEMVLLYFLITGQLIIVVRRLLIKHSDHFTTIQRDKQQNSKAMFIIGYCFMFFYYPGMQTFFAIQWPSQSFSRSIGVSFVFCVIMLILLEYYRRYFAKSLSAKKRTTLILILMFGEMGDLIISSIEKMENLTNYPPASITVIKFKNDSTLQTSDNLIFLGHSEKYLFLWHKDTGGPEIISADEVVDLKWIANTHKK
jgi:hypothetical protein